MKLKISKAVLADGLSQVVNIVPSKASLPILSNVCLKASGDSLQIMATDLDISMSATVPATVIEPGTITLPAKKFATVVREMPDVELTFVTDDDNAAEISASANTRTKLLGLPAAEFPDFPEIENFSEIILPQSALRAGFKRTEYAISVEVSRRVLMGLLFAITPDQLRMVATDGRRLAVASEPVNVNLGDQTGLDVILPANTVRQVISMMDSEGEVAVKISQQRVNFEIGSLILSSKLMEGVYPNYRQVIPQKSNFTITLPRAELMEVLRRVSILTEERNNLITITLDDDLLHIDARTAATGESHDVLPVSYKGPSLRMGFNPEFFIAPLKTLESDTVTMDITDEMSPSVLRDGERFLYVLMPIKPQ